jgi:arginase family enzyme
MIFCVPGVNGLGKTKGCEKAPGAICNALNLGCRAWAVDNSNVEEQEGEIYEKSKGAFGLGEKPVFIGGDHSISYPLGRAFLERFENPAFVVFDAHYDLMKPMQNPTHEEWLCALIENTGFKNVLIVGIRKHSENTDEQEAEFAKTAGVEVIYPDEFEKRKGEIFEFCRNKHVYLSLDLDVLDSSEFFATGYPEAGGLGEGQLIGVLRELKDKLSAVDIVEYNPGLDRQNAGLEVVKKILKALGEA